MVCPAYGAPTLRKVDLYMDCQNNRVNNFESQLVIVQKVNSLPLHVVFGSYSQQVEGSQDKVHTELHYSLS